MSIQPTRRSFLTSIPAACAVAALPHEGFAAAETLETTSVRLMRVPAICLAPQFVAHRLLLAEGFTDIRYIDAPSSARFTDALAKGAADFTQHFVSHLVTAVDAGDPVIGLAGIHVGCMELLGAPRIRSITGLKGKSVGVGELGSSDHLFAEVVVAHVGLDPARDIRWVTGETEGLPEQFIAGKLDAFVGSPPVNQDLRARSLAHVLANSALDRPWSEYFCCMLSGSRSYIRSHPVATKRVLRAFLKATDLCTTQPAWTAQYLVEGKFAERYDYALQALNEIPFGRWRDYDAEDSVRFQALRLRELGFIKSTPQKIIADGTDWRFLNELKEELKT
jgi:NitT/TauT family transport system substrate-binding protein